MEGEQEATTTHLADRYPQIDTPLRVEPPANMKAPHRVDTPSRDVQIRRSAYSPRAYVTRRTLLDKISESPGETEVLLDPTNPAASRIAGDELPEQSALGPFKTEVSNYTMLAFSSQRAGKREMEAQAYFAIGVLHDNVGQYAQALESFASFLDVAKKMQDRTAEGLAYNSMGVDCMLSACPPSASTGFGAAQLSDAARASLRRAVEYHEAHLKVADEGGRFMASTNLGLCYGALGDALASARHHQDALRIAIALQRGPGVRESSFPDVERGSAGRSRASRSPSATSGRSRCARATTRPRGPAWSSTSSSSSRSRTRARRSTRPLPALYLFIVTSTLTPAKRYMQLGHLAMADKDFETALKSFQEAAHIAEALQELGTLKRANCYVGIAKGSLTMADMFAGLTENIRAQEAAKQPKPDAAKPAPALAT